MAKSVRRVVTGHDANGKAIIVADGPAECILQRPNRPGVTLTNFWQTFETPPLSTAPRKPSTAAGAAPAQGRLGVPLRHLRAGGPGGAGQARRQGRLCRDGAAHNIQPNDRHPFMHRTDSVDYAVIVSGRIKMLMDEEADDVELHPGDVVIQRGTNHAWSNCYDEPCTIAFVLVDGKGDIPGVTD